MITISYQEEDQQTFHLMSFTWASYSHQRAHWMLNSDQSINQSITVVTVAVMVVVVEAIIAVGMLVWKWWGPWEWWWRQWWW